SASLRLSAPPVTAGAVASGGVAWGSAAPGLVEWGVSAELLGGADFAALRTAHRAAEVVTATFATEDGIVRTGRAYVTEVQRAREVNGAAAYSVTLEGAG